MDNKTAGRDQTVPLPKRHHFVPKFYLRRFADRKRRIRMYRRQGQPRHLTTNVNNAAVESGFYTTVDHSGEESTEVEALLSRIESDARDAIDEIVKGRFPPAPEARGSLALFMALQMQRTPEKRRVYEAMVDHTQKQKVMFQGWTPEIVRERLRDIGEEVTEEAVNRIMDVVKNPDEYRFVPHQNEHISVMLEVALKVAPVLAARSWILGRSHTHSIVTSDHPVVWWSRPTPEMEDRAYGVGNAEDVYFPLDPSHVLAMGLPGTLPEIRVRLTEENVLLINQLEADFSHDWVYQHPEDDRIDELIPDQARPIGFINGDPIFAEPSRP